MPFSLGMSGVGLGALTLVLLVGTLRFLVKFGLDWFPAYKLWLEGFSAS